jgi:hypothetical protein
LFGLLPLSDLFGMLARENEPAKQLATIRISLTDHTELFKQFQDNAAFKKWLADSIFAVTYQSQPGAPAESAAAAE